MKNEPFIKFNKTNFIMCLIMNEKHLNDNNNNLSCDVVMCCGGYI